MEVKTSATVKVFKPANTRALHSRQNSVTCLLIQSLFRSFCTRDNSLMYGISFTVLPEIRGRHLLDAEGCGVDVSE
jgi:hypothetical protein